MGKLVKNHWARLLILTASSYQLIASIECCIWPQIFWDFTTKNFDGAVKPAPILQIFNILLALLGLAWEWPLGVMAHTTWHSSIEARLLIYPISCLACALMYQGTNAAFFYLVGMVVWLSAFYNEEIVCPQPWTTATQGNRTRQPTGAV
ncbi:uncharacterized protein A1O9_11202 [Exophiala aquamarina CBS 119918]|uniref:DUF7727 domain-containing protein n=1 Tax=Exophiala aquamarina CBS 119918 TaxID=1182545 RepID=A0A072PB72_9EURO|nr:uncharacterized protein A1O9_11202 [Exophiala aquamarina CBS 119918]KEF52785.1 hypothetical protein A1O9_11202 [Exophiala aquamarina CBS 119918]